MVLLWEFMTPIFIEYSRVPVVVSKITGMNIWAVSFAFWVFGKGTLGNITRQHETIHFKQQLELLFIFQWILYGLFWLIGMIIYRSNYQSYTHNPFELEAYTHQQTKDYLDSRRIFAWWGFMWWVK